MAAQLQNSHIAECHAHCCYDAGGEGWKWIQQKHLTEVRGQVPQRSESGLSPFCYCCYTNRTNAVTTIVTQRQVGGGGQQGCGLAPLLGALLQLHI